jgi:signal peptidase II
MCWLPQTNKDADPMIPKQKTGKYLKLIGIAGVIVIIDQVTKAIVLDTIPIHHSIPVIPHFFNMTHILNPGGAFGFLADYDSGLRDIGFLVASVLVIGLIVYLYIQTPGNDRLMSTGFSLILGGAFGNLIDRFRFGKVIDFYDFYYDNLHFPAFNFADSAITVGVGFFLFHLFFKNREKTEGSQKN